ncbi:MAG TPA: phosphoesterase [Pirellulaceae bacterium]|nr:phosphoesterase [Pirellulaceae bacterium]HMO91055.1 phosphoesterase [Pirellulaceae bacterium]HMP68170.1 phosphoesterase [Pirellulaceae bacterium]
MSTVQMEHVLVVRTEQFCSLGYFQGFSADTGRYLTELFNPANTMYLPRDAMENDPSFKQLIPYVIFRHIDARGQLSVLRYTRGKGQGEQRLHSKQSIGIGGHISAIDASEGSPYLEGMGRELSEEVDIACNYTQQCVGLINDDSNEVGQVHLGIVHVFDVEQPLVTAKEHDLLDCRFVDLQTLAREKNRLESWSQICFDNLFQF